MQSIQNPDDIKLESSVESTELFNSNLATRVDDLKKQLELAIQEINTPISEKAAAVILSSVKSQLETVKMNNEVVITILGFLEEKLRPLVDQGKPNGQETW